MSELPLKHQGEEIATDRAGAWQAVFWSQHDFGSEPKDFPVNRGADYSRNIFVLGDEGSGYDDIKTWFPSTLWKAFARSVDLASRHERACSAISARAWRARRLRCFRKIAPSLASVARFRAFSAYWRNAARTSAPRLLCRGKVSASSSRSFSVASSIAIVFMPLIIAIVLHHAQDSRSVPLARSRRRCGNQKAVTPEGTDEKKSLVLRLALCSLRFARPREPRSRRKSRGSACRFTIG